MKRTALFASLTLTCLLTNALAQTKPAAPPSPMDQDKDDVVRITTNLVQLSDVN